MSRSRNRWNSQSVGSSKSRRTTIQGVVLCGMLAAAGLCYHVAATGEERATNSTQQATKPHSPLARGQRFIPPTHAELYEKLNRQTIQLDFEQASFEDALQVLAAKLGEPIKLDRTSLAPDRSIDSITAKLKVPSSLKYALLEVLQDAAFELTFDQEDLRVLASEGAAEEYVLRTHDLSYVYEYSTKLRLDLIEQIRQEVTPNEWQQADGPWIGPGTSVFAIDVYHRPEAQAAIEKLWYKRYVHNRFRRDRVASQEKIKKPSTPDEIEKRTKELQQKYPFESLVQRLDYESGKSTDKPALAADVERRLAEREVATEERQTLWVYPRVTALKELHSAEVAAFVQRDGFGFARVPRPSPGSLPLYEPPSIALPSAEIDPPTTAEVPARLPRDAAEALAGTYTFPTKQALADFHDTSEQIFVSPERSGFIKSREAVAGFAGHAMSAVTRVEAQIPEPVEPTEHWAIRRLELVSLLKHPTPKVYRSDTLPSMDKLATAPTRALNEFESAALAKLAEEEDVIVRATTNRIEMVGAVRASKNCLQCHSVERGQLLGAFSYTLIRDPLITGKESK